MQSRFRVIQPNKRAAASQPASGNYSNEGRSTACALSSFPLICSVCSSVSTLYTSRLFFLYFSLVFLMALSCSRRVYILISRVHSFYFDSCWIGEDYAPPDTPTMLQRAGIKKKIRRTRVRMGLRTYICNVQL